MQEVQPELERLLPLEGEVPRGRQGSPDVQGNQGREPGAGLGERATEDAHRRAHDRQRFLQKNFAGRKREERLLVAGTMRDAGLSLRNALNYSGCSWNLLYHQQKPRLVQPDPFIVEKVKELVVRRPSYGTRRVAAQLSRELETPINRKRVQKIFRALGYTEPAKTKSEIIRARDKAPKASRPCELWQTDLTYIPCGVDGWCYLFNVLDVFSREWAGKEFSPTAVKDNAILSVEDALVSHRLDTGTERLRLRADNGPQY